VAATIETATSARTGTSRRGHKRGASAPENQTTKNYPQQKKTPKLKDPSEEEKLREPRLERNQKRRREGGRKDPSLTSEAEKAKGFLKRGGRESLLLSN
jgi:hypothetical protein